jgi:ABC-type uncharacterized transport system substrate-binding protein
MEVMERRTFLGVIAGGLLAAPLAAEAQPAARVPRIGFLTINSGANPHLREAFLQGLRDLGYVEGRNVVMEYRSAEGKLERLPTLAAELVALKVDVIVTGGGTPTALAAKQATRTLPIVFTSAADPVTDGLVTSLARPGGNITGSSNLASELVGKCLERIKEAVPGVSLVAVLWQPGALGGRTDKGAHRSLPPGAWSTLLLPKAAAGTRTPDGRHQDVSRDGHDVLAGEG